MLHDLRYALRSLRKAPGFTTTAVLCLAMGIGANTAIFSLLDVAMLRSLPVADSDRLVVVFMNPTGRGGSSFSYPLFTHLRAHSRDAADVFAYGRLDLNLSTGGLTDAPSGLLVSENYFSALGVEPAIGRVLASADEAAVVLSYRYWRSRFQSDETVVGRPVTLNGVPFTVIGVARRGFFGTEVGSSPDVFVPLALRDRMSAGGPRLAQQNAFWLRVMGRVAPGVTTQQAASHIGSAYQQYTSEVGGTVPAPLLRFFQQRRIVLGPGANGPTGIGQQFGTPLWILMTVVCLVLLIACANVASLLLTRATARRREIAIRLALGAGRSRLLRQLLTESVVLALSGGAAGLVIGIWSANSITAFLTDRVLEVALDIRVLGFTMVASIITALLFGGAPAMRATRSDLTATFKSDSAGLVGRGSRLGRLLVPVQVALSLLLLVGAGLFIRTLTNLRTLDAGFRGDQVLLATVNPGLSRYTPERAHTFYAELLDRTLALPGVLSASVADAPLLGGDYVDGMSIGDGKQVEISVRVVGPRFFETMGIQLRAGRDFSAMDTAEAPRVAIINETTARKYFAGRDPIGTRVGVDASTAEIVGVIADTKYRGLREAIPNTVYLPLTQARSFGSERTLHVRTSADPSAMIASLREQIRALDGSLPVKLRPFAAVVDATLERERLVATLCGFFAAVALLLTSTGLYGLIAHNVQRRTREIGIRMSLGAERVAVLWMVLRDCLVLVALGVVVAAPLSVWLSRLVKNQLFGVSPGDPVTTSAATAVLMAVAALAGYLPARRASCVDPAIALRYE